MAGEGALSVGVAENGLGVALPPPDKRAELPA